MKRYREIHNRRVSKKLKLTSEELIKYHNFMAYCKRIHTQDGDEFTPKERQKCEEGFNRFLDGMTREHTHPFYPTKYKKPRIR